MVTGGGQEIPDLWGWRRNSWQLLKNIHILEHGRITKSVKLTHWQNCKNAPTEDECSAGNDALISKQ